MIFTSYKIGYDKVLFELDGIHLQPGMVYALIGPNGSGKSTFIRSLLGQQKVLGGSVEVNGRNLDNYSIEDRSKTIAFVSSQFGGIEHMSVAEYLHLGRTPYMNFLGRISKLDSDLISEMVERLNISNLTSKMTKEISDGERQLCSIARAFIQDTNVILMDEPTAFLDYGNKMRVIHQLNSMAKSLGKIILYSTHDIDLILEFNLQILKIVPSTKRVELVTNCSDKSELIRIF